MGIGRERKTGRERERALGREGEAENLKEVGTEHKKEEKKYPDLSREIPKASEQFLLLWLHRKAFVFLPQGPGSRSSDLTTGTLQTVTKPVPS